mgnify:FL=1|jgi:CTP:phosphocholine cytidylyltransferase-like protein/thiamine kinase-like enzyme
MNKNAIILAAGKSNKFAPFTYEKPKGLFRVKGEILIERQIKQLKEAGINEIYVVVGYMKEKFFYLEQKFGVTLIINNKFAKKGNLYSLYVAREYLSNSYICCADHYFLINPFIDNNKLNLSYRACCYYSGKFKEFAIDYSDANVITGFSVGGSNKMAMVGQAYFNATFSNRFRCFLEREIDDFGVNNLFWEEFYAKHQKELTLYMQLYNENDIIEFEDIEDLRRFDTEFLINVDSDIIHNICNVLNCVPNEINDISVINAGLTNVSFAFDFKGTKYVYRHPGGSSNNLIDRKTEVFAQIQAKNYNIDASVIYIDEEGWKLSYYVENAKNCQLEDNEEQLKICMDYLHKLHSIETKSYVKVFDNIKEGKRLMQIASYTKGNLKKEFADIIEKVEKLYNYIKDDAKELGYKLVLCHNDVYAPNYLYDSNENIYLIDWEYAGLNYEANDICCMICRYDWTDAQIEKYLKAYFGRELTAREKRFYYGFIPISAFYWFCWGLYKGSVGDDDGFFFLPSYHNLVRFIDVAIESYEI